MTAWTVACQAPLSVGFPRQECWSGLPFPSPEDHPNPGIKPMSPVLAGGLRATRERGKLEWGHKGEAWSSVGSLRGVLRGGQDADTHRGKIRRRWGRQLLLFAHSSALSNWWCLLPSGGSSDAWRMREHGIRVVLVSSPELCRRGVQWAQLPVLHPSMLDTEVWPVRYGLIFTVPRLLPARTPPSSPTVSDTSLFLC